MQTKAESLFLELLQCAIWDKQPDVALFDELSSEEWDEITREAKNQSVLALVADKILSLPESHLPTYEKRVSLFNQIEQISRLNLNLNKLLVDTLNIYQTKSWDVILLKGAGNATHYPDPTLRMPGDIDLFFCKATHYNQANEWIKQQGYRYQIDNRARQLVYQVGKFAIDIHKFMLYFEHKPFNKVWLKLLDEEINDPNHEYVTISGRKVRVLHPELNILFVFIHLLLHFIQGGVGMRQVCDWVLMMQSFCDKMDKKRFAKLMEQFELTYAMSLFARLAVDYLQAPSKIFVSLSEADDKHVKLIYREIMDGGNFGFNRKAAQGGWRNVPSLYRLMWEKNKRLRDVAPYYTRSILRSRVKAHVSKLARLVLKN